MIQQYKQTNLCYIALLIGGISNERIAIWRYVNCRIW